MDTHETGESFDVRDIRNRNWLWARREIIRAHGQELGVYGVAVYVALASFADTETQSEAKPSIPKIARMLDCSTNKVRDAIRELYRLDWIDYRERERPDGSQTSHLFRLLECPVSDPYHGGPPPSRDEGGPLHDMKGGTSRDEGHEGKGNRRDREKGGKVPTNQSNSPETDSASGGPGAGLEGKAKKVYDTLLTKGVAAQRADSLVNDYGPARCARQIRHFEIKVQDGQDVGPGLLVTLIEEDRELPTPSRTRSTHKRSAQEDKDVSDVNPREYFHLVPGTEEYINAQESKNRLDENPEAAKGGGTSDT